MPLHLPQLCCCFANLFIYFWLFLLLLSLRLITNVVVADINDFVIVVLGLTLLASFLLVYRHDFWVHVYLKICSLGAHAPSCRFGNTLGLWQHKHYDFSLMWTNCCGSQYCIRVCCTLYMYACMRAYLVIIHSNSVAWVVGGVQEIDSVFRDVCKFHYQYGCILGWSVFCKCWER